MNHDIDKNYIGITGFTKPEQVKATLEFFFKENVTIDSEIIPMLGLLISPRNLNPNWHSSRYPSISEFDSLIEMAHSKCFLTVHIDEKNTSNWLNDLLYLMKGISLSDYIDGIQVNVMHPKVKDIASLTKATGKKIIIQYSSDFLVKDIDSAIYDLALYMPFINYILIDPSRGRGLELDVENAVMHYKNIYKRFKIGIGFAGGFTPDNIASNYSRLIEQTGTIPSIDVESGVRTEDDLDLNKVRNYIHNACQCNRIMVD